MHIFYTKILNKISNSIIYQHPSRPKNIFYFFSYSIINFTLCDVFRHIFRHTIIFKPLIELFFLDLKKLSDISLIDMLLSRVIITVKSRVIGRVALRVANTALAHSVVVIVFLVLWTLAQRFVVRSIIIIATSVE